MTNSTLFVSFTNQWEPPFALCRRVRKYFKYAPGVSCLLGPLDALPKVKKQVQRIQRKPVGKAVAPQVLEREDAEQKVPSYALLYFPVLQVSNGSTLHACSTYGHTELSSLSVFAFPCGAGEARD